MSLDRRTFLKRSAVAAAGAAGAGAVDTSEAAAHDKAQKVTLQTDGPLQFAVSSDPAAHLKAVPFHGEHQAGITNPPPPAGCFLALDVTATDKAGLESLFKTITDRARFLTAGGDPPNLGSVAPPSDSGTLGPVVPADGLTVTLGVSSTLFDDRFGLAKQKPVQLTPMPSFPNDDLNPDWLGGDLIMQICAGSDDTALHALRDILKHTRGLMQVRWRMDGFVSPPRPSGVPRNNQGFHDGIANPDVSDPDIAKRILWVQKGGGEPKWAVGGSYHVLRLIRMYIEFWDRVSLLEQQTMIGRYRASGAPLGMSKETDVPDYQKDPHGHKIPLTAHIRLANPRTEKTADSRILRRGYNYDNGVDLAGNLNMGLIFNCFQQNLTRQFVANQKRLIGEPLVDYIAPFGGGYFFALPGVPDKSGYLGKSLIEA
jgi:deferrochelatase/peroxidase EfeB